MDNNGLHPDHFNIPERVAQGATLLDERVPQWPALINADNLAMVSTKDCVLGQLFGSFSTGVEELSGTSTWGVDNGVGWEWAAENGFHTRESYKTGGSDWGSLEAAWIGEIDSRLGRA